MDEVFSSPLQMPQPQPKRGGMFGGGGKFGWKEALAAGLAGFVSRRNPAPLQALLQMQMQKQESAQREQDYQRRQADQWDMWQRQQQYKQEHPDPINNDTVNDYNFISQQLGPDAGKEYLRTKTSPIVMTPYGPMPYSAVTGGGQAPAKTLTDDDILRMQGGPAPQAPGGFPRPY